MQKQTLFIGHNKDNEIRRKASSGGIARSIIVEGLTTEMFDGVYTLRKSDKTTSLENLFLVPRKAINTNGGKYENLSKIIGVWQKMLSK